MMDGMAGPSPMHLPQEYAQGQRVDFLGAKGIILGISDEPYTLMASYPIHVLLDNGSHLHFTPDGMLYKEQIVPGQLVVIAPPVTLRWMWVVHNDHADKWEVLGPFTDSEARMHLDMYSSKCKMDSTMTMEDR
jgi:hypothetical protein